MKRLLSIIGAISLIGTNTTSLVACKDKIHEYTPEELKELKEKNKIDTKNKEIKDNLEWIAPQEKPFNKTDNKWYYIIWRGNEKDNYHLTKFLKNNKNKNNIIDKYLTFSLIYSAISTVGFLPSYTLEIINNLNTNYQKSLSIWKNKNNNYFKSVYRWNLNTTEPNLIVDDKGNVKVKGE